MNKTFTQHITNALMQVREEKLKLKTSIPRKVEDGWKPIIKMKYFIGLDIECNASCPIVLGRPFLRTVGAIIDLRDGIIKYQFPDRKSTRLNSSHITRSRMPSSA